MLSIGNNEATERHERLMSVHEFDELGLEIWLELNPEWIYKIERGKRKPILLINTPPNVYPPLSISIISFENMQVLPHEFSIVFDSLVETALMQYGLKHEYDKTIVKRETNYGELNGLEVEFQADIHGDLSDVTVFLGKSDGKGPVLLQAYTLAGKRSHITEQLRRSWGNINYLN